MLEYDVERIKKAVEGSQDLFTAYARYKDLGGKMSFAEFTNFLVIFGVYVRRGCP